MRLASALEKTNQVKIIEHDPVRAKLISEKLDDSIVLVGDASDQELLSEEDVDNVDVFCSLTNSEEAKERKAKRSKAKQSKAKQMITKQSNSKSKQRNAKQSKATLVFSFALVFL